MRNRSVGVGYPAAMAWDTEGTRRRLKDAATAEFAAHGPDGTTMAAIAGRAGINKERLYKYYGDKRALFDLILADELAKLAQSITPPAGGFEQVGEFAGRTFDYYAQHPQLARLLLWEGLSDNAIADEEERTAHYRVKTTIYREAQDNGNLASALDADHLVFITIALAAWWFSVPQLAFMITGEEPNNPAEITRRRQTVVRAAELLARGDNVRPLRH